MWASKSGTKGLGEAETAGLVGAMWRIFRTEVCRRVRRVERRPGGRAVGRAVVQHGVVIARCLVFPRTWVVEVEAEGKECLETTHPEYLTRTGDFMESLLGGVRARNMLERKSAPGCPIGRGDGVGQRILLFGLEVALCHAGCADVLSEALICRVACGANVDAVYYGRVDSVDNLSGPSGAQQGVRPARRI